MNKEMRSLPGIVARCGILVALALIFSFVETLIPISFGVPGIKLGLANLVVLSSLYLLPKKQVFVILIARIVLSGFLFGNMAAILYSIAGGIMSFGAMCFMKKINRFSKIGVSIIGGVAHNLGQIIVAIVVVSNLHLAYYFPILMISGAVTGAVVGIISESVMRRITALIKE